MLTLKFRMTLPIQIVVMAAVMVVILSLSVSTFIPTFGQTTFGKNVSSEKNAPSLTSGLSANAQQLSLNAKGPIASMQRDQNGTWIIWGDWDLAHNASKATKISSSPFSFNATIVKVKPDNTEDIKYKIYNYKLAKSAIKTVGESSILAFNGTGTIKSKDVESQVPINIGIIDKAPVTASVDVQTGAVQPSWAPRGGTISILIDDKEFGNVPVYGIVKKAKFS